MGVAARYVHRELLQVFAVTLLVLLLIALGGRFIGYLQDAASGRYASDSLLTIIALRLPEFIQLILAPAYSVAVLVTLGRFYAEQEMVVLQSAGVGPARLLGWLGGSALCGALIVAVLAIWLTPKAQLALAEFVAEERARQSFESVSAGVFQFFSGGDRVTYADAVSEDQKVLSGVFTSERDPATGRVTNVWAESGRRYVDPETGSAFLLLESGQRSEGIAGQADYRVIRFEQLSQRLDAVTVKEPLRSWRMLEFSALGDAPKAQAEWHWRIGLPIFFLVNAMLALGISRVKPREGRFARVVPGLVLLLVYYFLMLALQNAVADGGVPAIVGLWPVHAVFAAIAAYLLLRIGKPVRV